MDFSAKDWDWDWGGTCEWSHWQLDSSYNRLNDGLEAREGHKKHLSTDIDIWKETEDLSSSMPITSKLRHVKAHQDDMHKQGQQGTLTRDVYWNVQMDKRAEKAGLTVHLDSETVLGSSPATLYFHGKPIHTKIGTKIQSAFLDQPLRLIFNRKRTGMMILLTWWIGKLLTLAWISLRSTKE